MMVDWDEAIRRIGQGEPVEDVLDEKSHIDREAFREFLAAEMGPRGRDALKHYDAAMRDHDNGTMRARSCWHSISDAQRRAKAMTLDAIGYIRISL